MPESKIPKVECSGGKICEHSFCPHKYPHLEKSCTQKKGHQPCRAVGGVVGSFCQPVEKKD